MGARNVARSYLEREEPCPVCGGWHPQVSHKGQRSPGNTSIDPRPVSTVPRMYGVRYLLEAIPVLCEARIVIATALSGNFQLVEMRRLRVHSPQTEHRGRLAPERVVSKSVIVPLSA
jgi:hypothetical protein